jgi:hypothetical protein
VIKLKKRIEKLTVQVAKAEDRFIQMQQKYIDEKREKEE